MVDVKHYPLSFLAALMCLGVGVYSFHRSRGRPERVSLARILLLASAWTSFSFSTSWLENPVTNTYVARAIYAIASFVPDAFCRLVLSLLPNPRPAFRWFARAVSGGSFVFVFLSFHPAFILGVQNVGGMHAVTPGPLFGFIVVYMFLGMGLGFLELFVKHKSLEGVDRNKLKYFTLGFMIAYLGAGIHFLSAYTGREPLSHDLLICLFAFFIFLGLWNPSRDFNELLRRFLVQLIFGAVLGIPTGFYIWTKGAGLETAGLAFAIVTLAPAVYFKFRERIVSLVDQLPLLRGKFVRPERLAREVMVVTEAKSLDEWARRTVSAVQDLFGARCASVLIRQDDMEAFLIKAGAGLTPGELGLLSIPFESPVVSRLESTRQCLLSECLEALAHRNSKTELTDLHFVHACALGPIFWKGKLFGLICVGAKSSGEMYNPSDVQALTNLIHTAENALAAVLAGQSRRQQSAFWAHDLHRAFGPKGAIGSLEKILRGDFGHIPEEARRALALANEDAQFVAAHIKKLTDPLAESPSPVPHSSIAETYIQTRDRFIPFAQEKGIDWRVNLPPKSLQVSMEASLLEHRVIANLVENAFRHTPTGGTVQLSYLLEGESFVGFVRDTGPGIPKEDIPRLFTPGIQLDPQNKGLAGLGLASVKSVIDAHGGRVWVESEVGKGTMFFFSLMLSAK